jgi:tight adherence protein C
MFLFVLGVLLLGAATALAARALTMPDVQAAERLSQIGSYGFGADQAGDKLLAGGLRGAFDAFADRIGQALAPRLGNAESEARKMLLAAGRYTTAPTMFVGYRVLACAAGGVAMLWLFASGGSGGPMVVFAPLFGAFAGWVLPQTILRKRAERRLAQIETGLPELIDLLVVTVEAGLGFSGSLQVAASRLRGPLGEEVRLGLQEQKMGLSTIEALSNMLDRCDTPSMRSFVRSVIQGETLGVSIGNIMRNLATEMRKRRQAAAEERAQKAPIKMLFPLILLIFPPIFIVLLYPAIHDFGQSFGGG